MTRNWNEKKVAVLGLGVEGFSDASYAKKAGATVTVLEPRKEDEVSVEHRDKAKKLGLLVEYGASLADLSSYDIIIRSQWIKPTIKGIAHAKQKGILVTSQIQLFLEECPGKIIGVTGTKGKGTTTSLIYEMLKAAGKTVFIGGNIGIAPLEFLDKITKNDWVVLELSSYQLQDVSMSPHIAVMLMITSEHLQAFGADYQNAHEDIMDYVSAKRNIVKFQQPGDFAILNRDYPATHESDVYTEGNVYQVSRERGVAVQGCFIKDKAVWVTQAGRTYKIIDTDKILLPGGHNLENVCAAVMAATLTGVPKETIAHVLKTFAGLEHRLELVREVNGVRYYDDSFSTTPETAIAAIESFKKPQVLILGGSSKGSDFSELAGVISKASNIRAIIGIGVEWEKIKEEILKRVPADRPIFMVEGAKDMQTIVQAAAKIAQSGDVVLLSSACAGFDMFKNYKDRGDQFKQQVKKLR